MSIRLFTCLSVPFARTAVCGGFAALGLACTRYGSIAAAAAGSAMLSAYVGS